MAERRLTWKGALLAAGYTTIGIAAGGLFLGILKASGKWLATPRTPQQAAAQISQ